MTSSEPGPGEMVAAMAAARMIGRYGARPLTMLSSAELTVLEESVERVLFASIDERTRRETEAQKRHGRAGLRLVAQDGQLNDAGWRSLNARRAARARWRSA